MKKVVLIPDSYKGSLSSQSVAAIMSEVIHQHHPGCQIVSIPISDGGEGFLDCLLQIFPGKRIPLTVKGPQGYRINSAYGLLSNRVAIIELALASGLLQASVDNDPGLATTFGVGELIHDAILHGANEIWIGLGGSATNDGGCGLAEALGMEFFSKEGLLIHPNGYTLSQIQSIALNKISDALLKVHFTLFTDVTNPLCGLSGASHVFAAQKGAPSTATILLEENMQAFSRLLSQQYQFLTDYAGAGAAGGAGVLLRCFFNTTVALGIEEVLNRLDFDTILSQADVVITGEGRLDQQTLKGKAISGIASRCYKSNVPLIAFVGRLDLESSNFPLGLTNVHEITPRDIELKIGMSHADYYLKKALESWISQQ